MRILHVARYAGPRVYKQALCQQWAGWDVTLMAGCTGLTELHAMVDKSIGWHSEKAMLELSYDVVIIHTTIATNIDRMLPVRGLRRTIWDCHDFVCNDASSERFDAIVCPSRGMADKFGDKGYVVYSKVPERLFPEQAGLKVDAVVLQGTIGNGEAWADYSGLEERLERPVFIYPSADDHKGHEHCKVMQRLPYHHMLSALTMYSAGYAGAANEGVTIHDCVTNKFWEYKAAGIPVITWRSDEMTELNEVSCSDNVSMELELPIMKDIYLG